MPDKDGWLTEEELLAKAEVGRFSLERLRAMGLVPKGNRQSLGRGIGTTRFLYPPIAVPMIRRAVEVRKSRPGKDGAFWGLWLDGYPIDIVRWIDGHLKPLQRKTANATRADVDTVSRGTAREPAKRTSLHRAIFRRLQEQKGRRHFLSWASAIGVGIEPALSLYAADSELLPAFNKATGASGPPDVDLEIEKMSVPRLRDIVAKANPDDLEQARRDCKTISDLVGLAEAVDWRRVRSRLDVPRQGVNDGRSGPIEPFERLVSMWRSFDARAAVIPYLIFVRGVPGYRFELDETFASKAVELRALADMGRNDRPMPSERRSHDDQSRPQLFDLQAGA